MARPKGQKVRLGARDLALSTIAFTKADLDAAPAEQKSFHLVLGQICNEVAILQSILLQALNGTKHGPQPVREVALGTAFLMARLLSGKLYEAYLLLNGEANGKLLNAMWDGCPARPGDDELRSETEAARREVNRYFGSGDALLHKIRNKLAFHIDQQVIDGAYERMPAEYSLADFHSSMRGSSFFGCSDTVIAVAVGEIMDQEPEAALNTMMDEVVRISGCLVTFAYGYMLGFCRTYLGRDKFAEDAFVLRDVPVLDRQRLPFFMKPSRGAVARRR